MLYLARRAGVPYYYLTRKKDFKYARSLKVKSEQHTISQYRHIEIKTVILLNFERIIIDFLSIYVVFRQSET